MHFYNLSAVHLLMLSCSISVTYINWLLGAGQKIQAPKPTDLGICSLLGTGSCRDKLRALHRKRRTQHATICCGHRFNTAIPAGSPLLSFCFCLLDAWVEKSKISREGRPPFFGYTGDVETNILAGPVTFTSWFQQNPYPAGWLVKSPIVASSNPIINHFSEPPNIVFFQKNRGAGLVI